MKASLQETLIFVWMVFLLGGLGVWSVFLGRNSAIERKLWQVIRGKELVVRDDCLLIGNVLLEGSERENLRKRKQAMVEVSFSAIAKFEVWPPKRKCPAYYVIEMLDGKTVYHVLRPFRGQEKEILGAIQARLSHPVVLRDELY
jgi:hypothetical protein